MSSCLNKKQTFLTEGEKSWNPYKAGQILIFKSSTGGLDSVFVNDVSYVFPDGLGVVHFNQKLRVSVSHTDPKTGSKDSETYFLTIAAERDDSLSYVVFGLRAKGAWFPEERYELSQLDKQPEMSLLVPYNEFNDVIEVEDRSFRENEELVIQKIYWSKSHGYIKYVKYDGTEWELLDVVQP